MPIETGYYRLPNGQLHVAALSRLPGSQAKMVDWWFGYLPDSEAYRRWHPQSHLTLVWDKNRRPGQYIGASQIIKNKGIGFVTKLRIVFHDPSEFMDTSKFQAAGVGVAICANTYDIEKIPRGRLIHLVRDTSYGCEVRSRFWMYKADDTDGRSLMQHCLEKMGCLADFLPALYAQKTGKKIH